MEKLKDEKLNPASKDFCALCLERMVGSDDPNLIVKVRTHPPASHNLRNFVDKFAGSVVDCTDGGTCHRLLPAKSSNHSDDRQVHGAIEKLG